MRMDGDILGPTAFRSPIDPISEGNKLQHHLVGGVNGTSDWKLDAGIGMARGFIRDKIAEHLTSLGCVYESFGFVTDLESKLLKDAASKEEYMNLGTLRQRLLCKMLEENLSHQVSLCPPPLNHMTIPNWNLALNCSSDASDLSFNLVMDSGAGHDLAVVNPTNQFGYSRGAAGVFADSDGQNALLLCDVARANSQMFFPPEQASIISAYHGGEGYHHDALEKGALFSGGNVLNRLDAPLNDHFQLQNLKDVSSGLSYLNKQSSQDISQVAPEVPNLLLYEDTSQSIFRQQLEIEMLESQQSQQQPHQQWSEPLRLSDAETKYYSVEPNPACSALATQTAYEKRELYTEEPLQQNHCMDFRETGSTFLQQSQSQIMDLHQNQQWLHQQHLQLDSLCDAKLKSFLVEQNEPCSTAVAQSAPKLLPFSSEESLENLLPLSFKHKVLQAYTQYRESFREVTDYPDSFLKYMHSRICNRICKCCYVFSLLSHYNACSHGGCDICEPVWYLSVTGKGNQELENVKGSFVKNFRNDNVSDKRNRYCSESMLSHSKRLKTTAHSLLSGEEETSRLLNLMEVQSHNPEFLPRLSSPSSPVCYGSEMVGINMELLSGPLDEHESDKGMENTSAEKLLVSTPDSLPEPNEGVVSNCRLDAAEDVIDLYTRLNYDTSPDLSREDGSEIRNEGVVSDCEPENLDLRMAFDSAEGTLDDCYQSKCKTLPALPEEDDAGFKLEENGVSTKFNKATLNSVNKLMERGSDCGKEIKFDSSKIMGMSLTETFTAEQIKDHMSSLKLCIGQSASKKKRGNSMVNVVTENECQLCGADNLALAPAPLYCSLCSARIKRSVIYYTPSEENVPRYCFCSTCHRLSRGTIKVSGNTIAKGKLIKKNNDAEVDEPWVQCDKCEGWQHQICALFNEKNNIQGAAQYVCLKCCLEEIQKGERVPLTASSVFGAKDLPCTKLSEHIEQRLFRRLQQERKETAKAIGKSIDEVPEAEDLVVREVLSVDKHLIVKQQFLDIFNCQNQNYPAEFPYKLKVILLFQKIEGVDVCLFTMYVQEYGAKCSPPNQRSVYISYLDSIKYFRPERETATGEALRTFVYHQILMGYLEYCKKRGFSACYLWACPPLKGEDYILYCHPEIQKTPKPDKLRHWYHSMLRKAIKDSVVVEFTNLYDHFLVPSEQCKFKISAAQLPYFDGEYWSVAAERAIKNIEEEDSGGSCSKVKKALTKNTLKAMGHSVSSGVDGKDIRVLQKLKQTILPKKEEFLVVHLQFICKWCHEAILSGWRWSCSQCKNFQLCERCYSSEQNPNHTHTLNSGEEHSLEKIFVDDVPSDTDDRDIALVNGLFFENRHTFLSLCQENNYQFDTLRRAKHSSMMILHYLFATNTKPTGLAATSSKHFHNYTQKKGDR